MPGHPIKSTRPCTSIKFALKGFILSSQSLLYIVFFSDCILFLLILNISIYTIHFYKYIFFVCYKKEYIQSLLKKQRNQLIKRTHGSQYKCRYFHHHCINISNQCCFSLSYLECLLRLVFLLQAERNQFYNEVFRSMENRAVILKKFKIPNNLFGHVSRLSFSLTAVHL